MKRAFFIVVFVVLTTAVFAQNTDVLFLNRPEGQYTYNGLYIGRYKGEEEVRKKMSLGFNVRTMLSDGELECVRDVLRYFQEVQGDTFSITISLWGYNSSRLPLSSSYVYVEITSATHFNYWKLTF